MSWTENWVTPEGIYLFLGDFSMLPQSYLEDEVLAPNQTSRSREKAAVHHFLKQYHTCKTLLKTPQGKPYFDDHRPHINYSHSPSHFLWGEHAERPIGVDTENFRDQILKIAPKFCTPEELEWAENGNNRELLTLIWSSKESIFKAYGMGDLDFKKQIKLLPQKILSDGYIHAELLVHVKIHFQVFYKTLANGICTWTLLQDLQQKAG